MPTFTEVERPGLIGPNAMYRAEGIGEACRDLARVITAEPGARARVVYINARKGASDRGVIVDRTDWAWRERIAPDVEDVLS